MRDRGINVSYIQKIHRYEKYFSRKISKNVNRQLREDYEWTVNIQKILTALMIRNANDELSFSTRVDHSMY